MMHNILFGQSAGQHGKGFKHLRSQIFSQFVKMLGIIKIELEKLISKLNEIKIKIEER